MEPPRNRDSESAPSGYVHASASATGPAYRNDDIHPVAMRMLAIQAAYVFSITLYPILALLAANGVFGDYSPKKPLTSDFLCSNARDGIVNRMCAFAPLYILFGYVLVWFQNKMVMWVPRLLAKRKIYARQRAVILNDFKDLEKDRMFGLVLKGWVFACMWATVSGFAMMGMVALSKGCEGHRE